MLGFPPYVAIQHNLDVKSCLLYAPSAFHRHGTTLLLISVRGSVDPRATECKQKD